MEPDDRLDEAIERWMRERPAPPAPERFTAGVMARVRQRRWRTERYWDVGFNLALLLGLLLVVSGVAGLAYMTGLAVVGRDALLLFGEALATVAERITPALPTYIGAVALTAAALGLWWWADLGSKP